MNLDELAEAIRRVSSGEVDQKLVGLLVEWKNNDEIRGVLKERIKGISGTPG